MPEVTATTDTDPSQDTDALSKFSSSGRSTTVHAYQMDTRVLKLRTALSIHGSVTVVFALRLETTEDQRETVKMTQMLFPGDYQGDLGRIIRGYITQYNPIANSDFAKKDLSLSDNPQVVAEGMDRWSDSLAYFTKENLDSLKLSYPSLTFDDNCAKTSQYWAETYATHLRAEAQFSNEFHIDRWDLGGIPIQRMSRPWLTFAHGVTLGHEPFDPNLSSKSTRRYIEIYPRIHFNQDGSIAFQAQNDDLADSGLQELKTQLDDKIQSTLSLVKDTLMNRCKTPGGRVSAAQLYSDVVYKHAKKLAEDREGFFASRIENATRLFAGPQCRL